MFKLAPHVNVNNMVKNEPIYCSALETLLHDHDVDVFLCIEKPKNSLSSSYSTQHTFSSHMTCITEQDKDTSYHKLVHD